MEIRDALNWFPINLALSSEVVMTNLLSRLQMVLVNGVQGDVVEMGCHAGDTSVFFAKIIETIDPSRVLHLYDSFQGLPDKDAKDNPNWGEPGSVKTAIEVVESRFDKDGLRMPVIHPGWFKDVPNCGFPDKVAFAFFDGDFHSSILDSFVRIYPRLSRGAVVCVHDFACDTWPGVTRACEEYLADKPEKVLPVCYLLGAMVKQ